MGDNVGRSGHSLGGRGRTANLEKVGKGRWDEGGKWALSKAPGRENRPTSGCPRERGREENGGRGP